MPNHIRTSILLSAAALVLSLPSASGQRPESQSLEKQTCESQSCGRQTEFQLGWISDQHVLGVNKEKGHATYIPYASTADLKADPRFKTPWLTPTKATSIDLNGTWKFKWVKGTPQGPGPSEFQAADLDDSSWDDIRVPLSWEMTGKYNLPTYNNVGYPHFNEPPHAMRGHEEHGITDHNATGFYRRDFDIPAEWEGKRVFLHFDGVYSNCVVWVNGKFVGYSQGANNDAEFDLTDFVETGKNQLSVRVYRWCDGSYLEGQDMWRLSGIHRDVYLFATPKTFIRDHVISVSGQSADATEGKLELALSIDNRCGEQTTKEVRMQLLDAEGRTITSTKRPVVLNGDGAEITLSTGMMKNLIPWHTENPYLYTIIVSQLSGGKEEMVFSTKYGFRNVQLVDSGDEHYFTINGKRVFFKGTNIHDTHDVYGRYVDIETMLRDITLMKRANINTVRTSHYPRQAKMYSMFDAYGLYVIDEADLECHANNGLTRDTTWTKAFVDRNERMVQRDRNHPSVIFWSLGNENGSGENMRHCYDAVRRLDSRFIHCHGDSASDMYSEMYPRVEGVRKLSAGRDGRPYILCEYAHAMGQAVGNLSDYWQVIEGSTGIVGACVWDWVDQAIYDVRKLRDGEALIDGRGFHHWTGGYDYDPWFDSHASNDKGFQGNFLNNGIVTPDRKWTAKLTEVKKVYQFAEFSLDGKILSIKNKYPFNNLGDFLFLKYSVLKDGVCVEEGSAPVDVPALQTGKVPLTYKTAVGEDAEYALNVALCLSEGKVWAEEGYALADGQFLLSDRPALDPIEAKGPLKVEGDRVSGKNFSVVFDENGKMRSYVFEGRQLLAGAPEYSDFRRIDNDNSSYDYSSTGIESHSIDQPLGLQDGVASLKMGAKGSKTNYSVAYCVYPDGELEMTVSFEPQVRDLRRLGLLMQFAGGFEDVDYYAKGPWSNFKDRQTGSYLGRYSTTVREMVDENTHPQTYGDRQDLRELTLSNKEAGLSLTVQTVGMVSFSLSRFDELAWDHNTQYNKLHWADLEEENTVFAHFDLWHRGIGNNSCGGDKCLPQYEVPYPGNDQGLESLTYTLRFIPELLDQSGTADAE